MFCTLLAHTFVNPLAYIIHQHTTPPLSASSASKELIPGTGPHFLWIGDQPCRSEQAMINMPAPQLPLSQLPSQNPPSPVTSDHITWAMSTNSSTRPFAPFFGRRIRFLILFTKDMCGPVGSLLSKADPSTPPFPQQILGSRHGTYPRFQLGMAIDPVHNRFVVACDLQGRPLPQLPVDPVQGEASPLVSLSAWPRWVLVFFSTTCFMDSSKLRITSSMRGFRCDMSIIQSFPSPAHLAIGVLLCYGTQLCASTFVRCRCPTPYSKRPGFSTMRSFFPEWNEMPAQL